jgi:mannose-6-phosphate isomerase-like protein (cupin superfamily)
MGSGYVVHDNDGAAFWFTDLLAVMKTPVGDGARRDLAFADALAPVGSSPPMHIHHDEDEAWYLLEGRMQFRCGDDDLLAEPGSFVFAPRGIPHSFLVEEGPARVLVLTTPGGFGEFVREAGQPAPERVIPPPAEPDVAALTEVAARHRIEIVGPPLAILLAEADGDPQG